MSTPPIDITKYYPPYVNLNPQLTSEDYRLIQSSWAVIKAGNYEVFQQQDLVSTPIGFWGMLFYETLFELDPSLQPLFKDKFKDMLIGMVDSVLNLLPGTFDQVIEQNKTEIDPKFTEVLINLAQRHVSYQVKADYYSTMGLAIIKTLEKVLGERLDKPTQDAWLELWSLICSVMIPAHIQKAQEIGMEI